MKGRQQIPAKRDVVRKLVARAAAQVQKAPILRNLHFFSSAFRPLAPHTHLCASALFSCGSYHHPLPAASYSRQLNPCRSYRLVPAVPRSVTCPGCCCQNRTFPLRPPPASPAPSDNCTQLVHRQQGQPDQSAQIHTAAISRSCVHSGDSQHLHPPSAPIVPGLLGPAPTP